MGRVVFILIFIVWFLVSTTTGMNLCEFEDKFPGPTDGCYNEQENNDTNTCPNNMVYDLCGCGQKSCQEPAVCQNTCDGKATKGCICPSGFYMIGDRCVPEEECGCYVPQAQRVMADGETYVNSNCSMISICSNGQLVRNGKYGCSTNGECKEIDGMRRCYCNDGYTGDGETCAVITDCMDIYNSYSTTSGIYTIKPINWPGDPFSVYCNMTDEGGWTVFQRRINGDLDFYLDWKSYKNGFGNVDGEHWLGNEQLYYLTNQKDNQLRVDLVNIFGAPYYSKFTLFRINNETDNYRLSGVGAYSGTAGDGLDVHRNYQFTTKDRDNDGWSTGNCAVGRHGAWWYESCAYSNLNGDYKGIRDKSIEWDPLPGDIFNVRYTEMKLRPV